MENFIFQNPVKIHFGKNCWHQIGQEAKLSGSKALIITGKSSSEKSGMLEKTKELLKEQGIHSVVFKGVLSNPRCEDADEAIRLARQEQVNMIVALGGGSVIDTAKAVCIGFFSEHPVFDFYMQKAIPQQALPLYTILTLAATGSEMNQYSVLQDTKNGIKRSCTSVLLYPKVSFLDPELTYSVPMNYTAYGMVDLIAHALEIYFGKGTSALSDHYTASIIRVAIQQAELLKKDPNDYEARAQVMWLASNALNNYLGTGKGGGDWGSHAVEHVLSVLYDIPHGAGLSIVFPAWLKHFGLQVPERLAFLAKEIFSIPEKDHTKAATLFIAAMEEFFTSIGSPTRLSQAGIHQDKKEEIRACLLKNKSSGGVFKMNEQDYEALLQLMF